MTAEKPVEESFDSKSRAPLHAHSQLDDDQQSVSKKYTSTEYRRGLCIERPAQVVGLSTRFSDAAPSTTTINESTQGLSHLDEGFLQLLLDDHPEGTLWYNSGAGNACYTIDKGNLLEEEVSKGAKLLISNFKGLRQMLFLPMKDPVSLKRLAGCFAWSTRPFPVFDDATDLHSLRGFIHVLESEVARADALAAVKQKEGFVSSVSHELSAAP
jgi:hypothetical protein